MKKYIRNLLAMRLAWFLIGMTVIPVAKMAWSQAFPSAKDAMGFVGFYEENLSLYTFLGDHRYELRFPGGREKFNRFVRRMGFEDHRVSDNEYLKEGRDWRCGATFVEGDSLKSIQYSSSSH